jgi:solute carrier family 25 S-adenosylmethionine transporter 26
MAGLSVDTLLFPLDTIKTRLQSKQGFRASGGFKGIYNGISSAALGSTPSAAAFFVVYEYVKQKYPSSAATHMLAASTGEIAACFIRVPTEVIKQRMQANYYTHFSQAVTHILQTDGVFKGLYRGYFMTLFRDIPFTCIQFPLWEFLKSLNSDHNALEAAVYGTISGGIAAALTTPLDVIKTRIMLSTQSGKQNSILNTTFQIYKQEGFYAFFKGIGPRVMWISIGNSSKTLKSIGGFIFLGAYDATRKLLNQFEK